METISISLAYSKRYGVRAAIVLSFLIDWSSYEDRDADGLYWVKTTQRELAREIELFSRQAVHRELKALVGAGAVKMKRGAGFDAVSLYAVNFDVLEKVAECYVAKPPHERRAIPRKQRKRVFARDDNRCTYCGNTSDLSIDHCIPVSKGGSDDDQNLVTACLPCNNKKGTLSVAKFLSLRASAVTQ